MKKNLFVWLKFPKPAPSGDWFTDSFPDALPQPTAEQTSVEIHAVLILKNSEGPMASQVGCCSARKRSIP
jgi:hypothetical protein